MLGVILHRFHKLQAWFSIQCLLVLQYAVSLGLPTSGPRETYNLKIVQFNAYLRGLPTRNFPEDIDVLLLGTGVAAMRLIGCIFHEIILLVVDVQASQCTCRR